MCQNLEGKEILNFYRKSLGNCGPSTQISSQFPLPLFCFPLNATDFGSLNCSFVHACIYSVPTICRMLIACALLGAEAGLTKTVPDHQVQIQDSGLSQETLEPDKTGQGVLFFFFPQCNSQDCADKSNHAGSNWDLLNRCSTVVDE